MTLCVLNVGYPLAPVGPDAVGGAEQVLSALDHALVREGHRSLVIAPEGSTVAGELIPIPAEAGMLDDTARARAQARTAEAIAAARRRWPVDLVHLHGIDFDRYLPPDGPTLVTLHLPLDWYPPGLLRPARPDLWLHTVSAAQAATAPQGAALQPSIPNGVDTEALAGRHAKRAFALLLGRICPEKGVHLALDAARLADMPLLIGGQVYGYEAHQRYFAEEVAPRLDGRRRFLGPLGFARKKRLLNAARCLLVPSLAAETSSLVAMEALAAGTPVVAFPHGALPDVVEQGRTGFLVHDVDGMARAMRDTAALDPEDCRRAARERFSSSCSVARYLDTYHRLAEGGAGAPARRRA